MDLAIPSFPSIRTSGRGAAPPGQSDPGDPDPFSADHFGLGVLFGTFVEGDLTKMAGKKKNGAKAGGQCNRKNSSRDQRHFLLELEKIRGENQLFQASAVHKSGFSKCNPRQAKTVDLIGAGPFW